MPLPGIPGRMAPGAGTTVTSMSCRRYRGSPPLRGSILASSNIMDVGIPDLRSEVNRSSAGASPSGPVVCAVACSRYPLPAFIGVVSPFVAVETHFFRKVSREAYVVALRQGGKVRECRPACRPRRRPPTAPGGRVRSAGRWFPADPGSGRSRTIPGSMRWPVGAGLWTRVGVSMDADHPGTNTTCRIAPAPIFASRTWPRGLSVVGSHYWFWDVGHRAAVSVTRCSAREAPELRPPVRLPVRRHARGTGDRSRVVSAIGPGVRAGGFAPRQSRRRRRFGAACVSRLGTRGEHLVSAGSRSDLPWH